MISQTVKGSIMNPRMIAASAMILAAGLAWVVSLPNQSDAG
jgi:hypothetical protein